MWIRPLQILIESNKQAILSTSDPGKRCNKLVKLNVQMGIYTLFRNRTVNRAIRDKGLRIQGVIYDSISGKIIDLGFGNSTISKDTLKDDA